MDHHSRSLIRSHESSRFVCEDKPSRSTRTVSPVWIYVFSRPRLDSRLFHPLRIPLFLIIPLFFPISLPFAFRSLSLSNITASSSRIDLQHPFGNILKSGVSQDALEPVPDPSISPVVDDDVVSEAGSDAMHEYASDPADGPVDTAPEDELCTLPGAFMDINGKRVQISTVIKNTIVLHERVNLVSRLEKVKTFTPTTSVRFTELEAEAASSEPANTISLGDYVPTLVRFGDSICRCRQGYPDQAR
ncbi:hypothetical protein PENSPDRAFT_684264 [Peniophora sp. CONT]|nr:hypothetical protein PENSPDRAFT_684264 [Peniophora sp. CONT]